MDTREASLKILELALHSSEQSDLNLAEKVKVNITNLENIHKRISKIDTNKLCEPDDLDCQRLCQQRRERIVNFLMATSSKESLQNIDFLKRIDFLIEEYQEVYKQVTLALDFFDGSDIPKV